MILVVSFAISGMATDCFVLVAVVVTMPVVVVVAMLPRWVFAMHGTQHKSS